MTEIMLKTPLSAVKLPAGLTQLDVLIDRQIRAFLDGDSDGEELLLGLYGEAIDEPIPARLTALLRR